MNARLEHESPRSELARRGLEALKDRPADPHAAMTRLDKHSLDLSGRRVDEADGAAADRALPLAG